ncbi:hypothetical protein [Tropicimonas aquimaris]|uniref:DUF1566 domain-containing protein n=1 Tax=Tropicimonas aquimaris TaxID=914152 RepID=A0ABW3IQF5_9RHOB
MLFAALSYAVSRSMQGGSTSIENEQAQIDQAVVDNYTAALNVGKMRLEMAGCSSIDYTPPADQVAGDKSCHMFHPDGANVSYQDFSATCPTEILETALGNPGDRCGLIIYAGTSGGNRLYTTPADLGQIAWNNGTSNWTGTGATSTSNGVTNTDTLVALSDAGTPYQAAAACRGLGPEWYLPAQEELNVLYVNRSAIGGFNESGSLPAGYYWSSTEYANSHARHQRFNDGSVFTHPPKDTALSVRCVRR